MSATQSIGGLISGLDTNSILDQLAQAAQAPITRMQSQEDQLKQQSTAWSQLEAALLAFSTSAVSLATPDTFDTQKASVNHADLAAATASSDAMSGMYSFSVEQLAQSHQVASQGFADTSATEVGSGTISLAVGDADPTVISVDGFTLAELRDAINAADAGVSASIINDGSSAPYRLVLTSKTSGLAGQMQVQTSLSGGTAPAFADLQAARDAKMTLGTGAGAITVTSSSNRVEGAIPGVTIDLLGADPGTPVTLTVSQDNSAVQQQVSGFVDAYNAIINFFAEQFQYDPDTGASGTLFGDYRLESLQADLGRAMTDEVLGITSGSRALSDIGISTLSDGTLSLDTDALAAALANGPDDVAQVFAAIGKTTSPEVTYLTSSADTMPSGAAGWEVDVTQAATQSRVTAGAAQGAPLDANETLTIRGRAISLTAGMTQADVIAAINAHQSETGVVASATGADGTGTGTYLTLTRTAYGSAYHIEAVSSTSNQSGSSSGIGSVSVTDDGAVGEAGLGSGAIGLDVQGTIGGEAATGSGRQLTGTAGASKGLVIMVAATAPGSYGRVTFTLGAAASASRATALATDATDGTIADAQTSISDETGQIDQEIEQTQETIDADNARMKAEFTSMEEAMGRYQSIIQYITGQVTQMAKNASSS
jgi:flagellar hook-associated protein 2